MIKREIYEEHLIERHGRTVQEKIFNARVGVAGLGGLGSNIAIDLARIGIGKLVLVDFDSVELSNINRQAYFLNQIGERKTDALIHLIRCVNPFVELEVCNTVVDGENAVDIFKDVDIVVEAFDNPESKAVLVEQILLEGNKPIISASGMAGYGSSNTILTKKIRKGFYICGDGKTGIENSNGLMAPRVHVASGHQANMVLRLILGEVEE